MIEVKEIIEDAVRHSVAGVAERLLQGAALRCNPDGTLEVGRARELVTGSFMDRTMLTFVLLMVHDFADERYFGRGWTAQSVPGLVADLPFLAALWLIWRTHWRRS